MEEYIQFIISHWMLCAAWTLVLVVLIGYEIRLRMTGIKQLSPHELTMSLNQDQAVIIDVRSKQLYKQGHISQAVHIDRTALNPDRLQSFQKRSVIIVCQNGQQSLKLANQLRKQTEQSIAILREGIHAWQQAKLPLVTKS